MRLPYEAIVFDFMSLTTSSGNVFIIMRLLHEEAGWGSGFPAFENSKLRGCSLSQPDYSFEATSLVGITPLHSEAHPLHYKATDVSFQPTS